MTNPSLLPPAKNIPVDRLAAIFDNTTNSYKFYWFLAILECVKENQSYIIPTDHLVARMIGNVWYPINYFRLSFGKQDRLDPIVLAIASELNLAVDLSKSEIVDAVAGYMRNSGTLARAIASLKAYVPYRFQRPFFESQLRGVADWKINRSIREMSDLAFYDQTAPCIYRYTQTAGGDEGVEVHPRWLAYLQMNLPIIRGYCLWNLVNYLQRNNPNVPNIPGKIFAPERRNLGASRRFWQAAITALGQVCCIYSGATLQAESFSLDHFIPWSYVAHDLMWNIIPTRVDINSAKNDRLPNLSTYLDPFAQLQYDAIQAVAKNRKANLLEDYVLLCGTQSINELQAMPVSEFKQILRDTIAPQIQIAKNMGFVVDWSYAV